MSKWSIEKMTQYPVTVVERNEENFLAYIGDGAQHAEGRTEWEAVNALVHKVGGVVSVKTSGAEKTQVAGLENPDGKERD